MKKIILVAGLGNPEGRYFNTYHNVGFICAEKLAAELGAEFKKRGNQLISTCSLSPVTCYLLKPLTYMNLSGQAVAAVARKYKIAAENIIVFVDDLYIDKGNLRVSFGGSSGGHNGLRSINEILGTNQYIKIRVGIKPATTPHNTADYVLSKIQKGETLAIEKAVEAALMLVNGEKIEKVQNAFNTTNAPKKQ